MKLLRMAASFGRLDHEELILSDGLNVLAAPNEAGKSTWSAFLLAMLYGVDTAERATKTSLPAKTRFLPWSGAPMEGRIDLVFQGKAVTLERSSAPRAPMGVFRAYETDTGRPLDGLTAENCGRVLLGAERSVYERSGFIRQSGLAVTGDAALEARLVSLVTTGEEDVSFSRTDERLRALLNRRRHNKTGLLPQYEAELSSAQAALDSLRADGEEAMRLRARRESLEAEELSLTRTLAALRARETAEKRAQLEKARAAWEKERGFLAEKEATVKDLPPLADLRALQRQADLLAETGRVLSADEAAGVETPAAPACPPVFENLDADGVRDRAETDARALEGARVSLRPKAILLGAAAAVCLLAGLAGLFLMGPAAALAFVPAALAAVFCVLTAKKEKRRAADVRAILSRYGVPDAAAVRAAGNDRREALLLYGQALAAAEEKRAALSRRRAEYDGRRAAQLAAVRAFAPAADEAGEAAALQQAVNLQLFYEAGQRTERQARERYEAVRAAVGVLPAPSGETPSPLPDPVPDARELSARLDAVRASLQETRAQLGVRAGRMESAGDPAALAARAEELTGKIGILRREYDALSLARDALGAANAELQTRFSPKLNALAGELAAKMTGSRYDRVLLSQDMTVEARPAGGLVTRPLAALSGGAADQLYLAVRLAICRLALGPDAPLVLDDALVSFDDARMGEALALLRGEARTRQILLFTCQGREQAWLAAHPEGA